MCTLICSVLFFSSLSEGWPHHGRTFSIYLCPLSLWLTLPRRVLSTFWCCPSIPRPCVVVSKTVQLLRQETPLLFFSSDSWPPELPDLNPVDQRIRGLIFNSCNRIDFPNFASRFTRKKWINFFYRYLELWPVIVTWELDVSWSTMPRVHNVRQR